MLTIFPDLLTYQMLSPLILRVALGILFIDLGYFELTSEKQRWQQLFQTIHFAPATLWAKMFGILEIVGGLLLIVGLYTQGAALFFAIVSLAELYIEYREPVMLKRNLVFYMLLCVISCSLLLTGAGSFAFDLPL